MGERFGEIIARLRREAQHDAKTFTWMAGLRDEELREIETCKRLPAAHSRFALCDIFAGILHVDPLMLWVSMWTDPLAEEYLEIDLYRVNRSARAMLARLAFFVRRQKLSDDQVKRIEAILEESTR